MPEPEVNPDTRVGAKGLEKRIEAIETTQKALLQAIKEIEKYQGENFMPEGTYHGVKFE